MSVDTLRPAAAGQQSTGVVKDVQKSAQAGIGGQHFKLIRCSYQAHAHCINRDQCLRMIAEHVT